MAGFGRLLPVGFAGGGGGEGGFLRGPARLLLSGPLPARGRRDARAAETALDRRELPGTCDLNNTARGNAITHSTAHSQIAVHIHSLTRPYSNGQIVQLTLSDLQTIQAGLLPNKNYIIRPILYS